MDTKTDYKTETLRRLDAARGDHWSGLPREDWEALVYSHLAIAEGQERVATALEQIVAVLPGDGQASIGEIVAAEMKEITYSLQMAANRIGSS